LSQKLFEKACDELKNFENDEGPQQIEEDPNSGI